MDRFMIVGTSHVSHESQQRIKHAFAEFMPGIICIELDRNRLEALMGKEKQRLGVGAIRQLGLTGYLFALIGRALQKRIGDLVGMNPGQEMLLGAELARKNKLGLALIDQPVDVTLKNLSHKVRFREKMKIVWDMLTAPFQKKEKVQIDLSRIPPSELIARLLTEMKGRYPGFYRVLLDDRNRYMARKVFMLLKQYPDKRLLIIVGAGHVEGMHKYIKSLADSNLSSA